MLFGMSDALIAAAIGMGGGLILGLAARIGRFCTLGAIEDYLYQGSDIRLRMWAVAIGIAVLGTQGLIAAGLIAPGTTLYLGSAWWPLASIGGGLVFGYGMALAGNCGFGALARLGGGDLRSFVIVMVMGLAAYITLSGPLAYLRVWAFPPEAADPGRLPGIGHGLGGLLGIAPATVGLAIGATILLGALASREMRARGKAVGWGAAVGLAVVSGWAGTAWLNAETLGGVAVVSHTYSAPLGETMLYLMTASGSSVSFAVGSVLGVLAGAFLGSLVKGHFRWEACEDPRELKRQILGAGLMGVGAVVAAGCTIGQGISAFALLAYSAPVTLAAIFAGAALGLRQLIEGFHVAAE